MKFLNMKELALAKLWKKHFEIALDNDTKDCIRKGEYSLYNASYGSLKLKKYSKTHYYNEKGEEIELDTAKIIEAYCKAFHITKRLEVKPDYTIEVVPTAKAETLFNKLVNEMSESDIKSINTLGKSLVADKTKGIR